MENRAGTHAPSCSLDSPRGGSKPKIPPVPKLNPSQIHDLKDWAGKHLPAAKKK